MTQALYKNFILVDGNADGIFDIHNPEDQIFDQATGKALSVSHVLKNNLEMNQKLYFLDSHKNWVGESQFLDFQKAYSNFVSPSQIKTAPKLKGFGALTLAAAAVWAGYQYFGNDKEKPFIEVNPEVEAVPEKEYFTVYSSATEEVEADNDADQAEEDVSEEEMAERAQQAKLEGDYNTSAMIYQFLAELAVSNDDHDKAVYYYNLVIHALGHLKAALGEDGHYLESRIQEFRRLAAYHAGTAKDHHRHLEHVARTLLSYIAEGEFTLGEAIWKQLLNAIEEAGGVSSQEMRSWFQYFLNDVIDSIWNIYQSQSTDEIEKIERLVTIGAKVLDLFERICPEIKSYDEASQIVSELFKIMKTIQILIANLGSDESTVAYQRINNLKFESPEVEKLRQNARTLVNEGYAYVNDLENRNKKQSKSPRESILTNLIQILNADLFEQMPESLQVIVRNAIEAFEDPLIDRDPTDIFSIALDFAKSAKIAEVQIQTDLVFIFSTFFIDVANIYLDYAKKSDPDNAETIQQEFDRLLEFYLDRND